MFCAGSRPDCAHCRGEDRIPIHRCPRALATKRELDCVTACGLVEHGILPDPGGWQDQAATFTAAYPIVMSEIWHWRRERQRLEMEKANRRRSPGRG